MTDLEKAKERTRIAQESFDLVKIAANDDRKLSHDKHSNGNYVKALDALQAIILSNSAYEKRLETLGK